MGGGDKNIVEADDEEEVIEEVEEPVKKTTEMCIRDRS